MTLKDQILQLIRIEGPMGLETLIERMKIDDPDIRAVNIKIEALDLVNAEYIELDDVWRFTAIPYDVQQARFREAEQQQIDETAVDRFSFAMKSKLAKSRRAGRAGWNDKEQCSQEDLSSMLRNHVDKGDPVDVANFCMFLHQRGEGIL